MDLSESMEVDNGTTSENLKHVQITFFSKDKDLPEIPDAVFDVPTVAECDGLNLLLNKTIQATDDAWKEKKFEFLVGETFLRTSLAEFIEEYEVETETILKVECIIGIEAPKPLHDIQAPDWVSSVQVANGHIFSTTYGGDIVIVDRKGKETKLSVNSANRILKCSGIVRTTKKVQLEGTEFIVGGENQLLTLYEIEKGALVEKIVFRGHERAVECVSVNSDATRAISGSVDTNLKVWNLDPSDEATIYEKEEEESSAKKKRKKDTRTKVPMVTIGGHRDKVSSVVWCPWKSGHAFSCSWDHTVVQWDLELAGEVSRIKGPKSFTSIDIHPTSNLLISSCTDAIPRLYDPKNRDGAMVKQSFIGHQNGWVESVKWNPVDENQFVSVSTDKTAKMWDVRSSKSSLFDIHGHEDRILCAAWNEGLIATGSADCSIKIFETS
ncbi:hypothetical protein L5515_000491 [Caenorhabditis briggsae]|uniref:Ribosome biogenesis protein WDR12 homolog n=1 Tax=Caenorhabditis briggsae TaxID=6238 RepID=A0AAE9E045_CAEBR|nr:hypothetical protein L5515_000491 [Caenorhabditis briggsae]